jgi:8-oxo-dGTP diphosphatase
MSGERFKLVTAVHLFLLRDGLVLLSRRANTGYEDGKYSVPAGHLEGDEEVRAAATREAAEELGICIRTADLDVVGVMHRRALDERIDFFLSATKWDGEPVNRQPGKCAELAWFPVARLPGNVVPYVARAIANGAEGRWFDAYGWE